MKAWNLTMAVISAGFAGAAALAGAAGLPTEAGIGAFFAVLVLRLSFE